MENKKETTFTRGKKTESAQGKSRAGEEKGNAREIFSNFAKTTSEVVEKAAMILEEEVAAGVIAAKHLENQFIDSKKIRAEKDEVVMQRFRDDAHEVIDIMMDALTVVTKFGKKISKNFISVVEPGSKSTENADIPTLEMPEPIKAGEQSEVVMTLQNNSEADTELFTIVTTDLVSAAGKKIISANISLDPKEVKIKASQKMNIKVIVKVPAKTSPGTYSGLLQASNLNNFKAIIVVNVAD
jgi:hypothetical protein